MSKYLLVVMVALGGIFTTGCMAEVSECEDTEAAAEAEEGSSCDVEAAPPKEAASLSNEEQE